MLLRIYLITVFMVFGYFSSVWAGEELSWPDCLREAAKNHPELIAAREEVIQQQAAKTITKSTGLPQISTDLNVTTSRSTASGASNAFNYGISGSQLLFNGFKTVNNVKAASENIKAARENFRFTSVTLRLRLRTAFINLLKAQELLNLTQEIYKIRKDNVELISLRYQSGTEHQGALFTAQANLSQADYEINQARRGLETARRQLMKELGRNEFSPIQVKADFEVSHAVTEKPDFEALAQKNPSFLKIIAQKNAAEFDAKASIGDFWPTMSLTGGVSRSDSRWPPRERGSSAGVKVSLPLF